MYVCIYTPTHTLYTVKCFKKKKTPTLTPVTKSVNVFSDNLNHYVSHNERLVKVVEMCLVFTASAPVKQERDVVLW